MQQIKLKQIDGIAVPTTQEEWESNKDQLVTAEAISQRINERVDEAMSSAVTAVNASAESGKYVSALAKSGNTITATKTALPVTGVNTTNTAGSGTTTKALVSLALAGGKVVATEKTIAFPSQPRLTVEVSDFVPEIGLKFPALDEQSILVFVNGLLQSLADLTLTADKVSFKNPTHYAKATP